MPFVSVIPTTYVDGWYGDAKTLPTLQPCPVVPIRHALEARHSADALFWPGYLERGGVVEPRIPRLNKGSEGPIKTSGFEICFGVLVYDIDQRQDPNPSRQELDGSLWMQEEMVKISRLPHLDSCGFYRTRGGYRLLFRVPKITLEQYLPVLHTFRQVLEQVGIVTDVLKDWTRCYYLPRICRDGEIIDLPLALEDMERPIPEEAFAPYLERAKSAGTYEAIARAGDRYKAPEKILTGGRNTEMVRLAGALRRSGLTPEGILASLRVENAARCLPPLDDAEIEHIANQTSRWEAGAPLQAQPLPIVAALPVDLVDDSRTPGRLVQGKQPLLPGAAPRFTSDSDAHIAEHVLSELENNGHPMAFDRGCLWKYNDKLGVFETVAESTIWMVVSSFDQEMVLIGENKTKPFRAQSRSCRDIASMIYKGRSTPGYFDEPSEGVAFANGFARMVNGSIMLHPHSPRWKSVWRVNADYVPDGYPSQFIAFLHSCFKGSKDAEARIEMLRQFVGCCLLGRATDFAKGLILFGTGANGKSTFLKIIQSLFNGSAITAIPPQDMGQEYRRAMLANSRLNVVSELPEADIMESESVKAILAGDRVQGRRIREEPFDFTPKAGHIFAANRLPSVRDLTDAFFRRWEIVPFDRQIPESERIIGLDEQIIRSERPLIAKWMLDGACVAINKGRYSAPESSTVAVSEWRSEADPVASFLQIKCEIVCEQKDYAEIDDVYQAYKEWATANGFMGVSSATLGRRLRALNVDRVRTNGKTLYGVRLTHGRPGPMELPVGVLPFKRN